MFTYIKQQKRKFLFSTIARLIVFVLSFSLIFSPTAGYAQSINLLNLPAPGTMVLTSPAFNPAIVTGIKIYPDNPLQFDFIIDIGDDQLQGEALKQESQKLINYFMATLTVPEDEMWVNLSPYEKDRIIAEGLSHTEMGRDMLAQDYLLKQLTASLMYPEDDFGKEFWNRVYSKAQAKYGTTEIPMNTFNKIWIVPDDAVVYVNESNVFVVENHLKVMLEEDYLALESNKGRTDHGVGNADLRSVQEQEIVSGVSTEIVREVLLPEIEKEVNQGKNFANLRQMYNSMLLATWYKKNLKDSLLGQVYANKNKVNGIELEDKEMKQKIYDQYVEAFDKGVYNYIKEDIDSATQEVIPRKYFSGGLTAYISSPIKEERGVGDSPALYAINKRRHVSTKMRWEPLRSNGIVSSPISEERRKAIDILTKLTKERRPSMEVRRITGEFDKRTRTFPEESQAKIDHEKDKMLIGYQEKFRKENVSQTVIDQFDVIATGWRTIMDISDVTLELVVKLDNSNPGDVLDALRSLEDEHANLVKSKQLSDTVALADAWVGVNLYQGNQEEINRLGIRIEFLFGDLLSGSLSESIIANKHSINSENISLVEERISGLAQALDEIKEKVSSPLKLVEILLRIENLKDHTDVDSIKNDLQLHIAKSDKTDELVEFVVTIFGQILQDYFIDEKTKQLYYALAHKLNDRIIGIKKYRGNIRIKMAWTKKTFGKRHVWKKWTDLEKDIALDTIEIVQSGHDAASSPITDFDSFEDFESAVENGNVQEKIAAVFGNPLSVAAYLTALEELFNDDKDLFHKFIKAIDKFNQNRNDRKIIKDSDEEAQLINRSLLYADSGELDYDLAAVIKAAVEGASSPASDDSAKKKQVGNVNKKEQDLKRLVEDLDKKFYSTEVRIDEIFKIMFDNNENISQERIEIESVDDAHKGTLTLRTSHKEMGAGIILYLERLVMHALYHQQKGKIVIRIEKAGLDKIAIKVINKGKIRKDLLKAKAREYAEKVKLYRLNDGRIVVKGREAERHADSDKQLDYSTAKLISKKEVDDLSLSELLFAKGLSSITSRVNQFLLGRGYSLSAIKEGLEKQGNELKYREYVEGRSNYVEFEMVLGTVSKETKMIEEGDPTPTSSPVQYGGIDFNPNNINLKEQGDKMQINFSASDPLILNPESINGILPVIINISPLPSILPLLGLEPQREEDFELSSLN